MGCLTMVTPQDTASASSSSSGGKSLGLTTAAPLFFASASCWTLLNEVSTNMCVSLFDMAVSYSPDMRNHCAKQYSKAYNFADIWGLSAYHDRPKASAAGKCVLFRRPWNSECTVNFSFSMKCRDSEESSQPVKVVQTIEWFDFSRLSWNILDIQSLPPNSKHPEAILY